MKDTVDVIEIWMPVEKDWEVYNWNKKKGFKLVAYIVNGHPIRLEEGFLLEKRPITKQEADNLLRKE